MSFHVSAGRLWTALAAVASAALLNAHHAAASPPQVGQPVAVTSGVPVQEHILDNGMKLLLVERHDTPSVSAGWLAHVGSVNESYGITGIAHLFEHMMFKGTTTIGTKDWERESAIMARLDEVRQAMELEYSSLRQAKLRGEIAGSIYLPENETPRLHQLREQMKALQEEQRQLLVKDEIDQIYTELGASDLNAGTSIDMTAYVITVPANKLELWFWMESERLLHPVFREFYSERDVVREERRAVVESDPTARYDEQFDFTFWGSIPYHHPTVGWPADVESISRAQAADFFATYYAPNNITAVLVGDFDPATVLDLAKTYFGRIPRGAKEPPEVITEEIEQLAERRMVATADTNPEVRIRWHAVSFVHRDSYALDVLSDLLSDRTGRLYRALVEEQALATGEPYAVLSAEKYAGYFEIGAEVADGHSHEEIEAALLAQIERLKVEPVPPRELAKVKNQSLANSYRSMRSNVFLMFQLLLYDGTGNWHHINEVTEKTLAVSPEDIMAVARNYLTAEGRNVLWYHRREGSVEDPELAGLSDKLKAFVGRFIKEIETTDDVASLASQLDQIESQRGELQPDLLKATDVIIRHLRARIEELESARRGES